MKIAEILELRRMGYTKDEIRNMYAEQEAEASAADAHKSENPSENIPVPTSKPVEMTAGNVQLDPMTALNQKLDTLISAMQSSAIRNSTQPEAAASTNDDILAEFLVPNFDN